MHKRFAIIGNSGSGKTTLARQLLVGQTSNILDLDTVAWASEAPTTLRDVDEATADIITFCTRHADWVVEGCYTELIRTTFEFTPTLIFLDPGVEVCLSHCKNRPWEPHKYASKAAQDQNLHFLLEWVKAYYTREGDLSFTAHSQLYNEYTGPKQRHRGIL